MESLTKLVLFFTGVVVVLSLIEAVVLSRMKSASTPFAWYEVWISLFDLAARRLMSLLPISVATPIFSFVYDHRIFTVDINSTLMVFALFIGMEFCYYWYHRTSHRVRFFWATHAVHHSPNQLTLSTAYRLGVTGKLTGSTLFFAPLVWLGIKPEVVLLTLFLNLMYQGWLHTTYIPKLGWFEYVFNTPSAHRVHHASNVTYLDANYGGVLIIFDRLFGTYVEERADEPCRYGLVTPTTSRNPLVVEFEHWATLIRDVVKAKNPWIAINHVIQPPGWLPDGGGETTEELRRKGKQPRATGVVNG